jgi:hypothetical protein
MSIASPTLAKAGAAPTGVTSLYRDWSPLRAVLFVPGGQASRI